MEFSRETVFEHKLGVALDSSLIPVIVCLVQVGFTSQLSLYELSMVNTEGLS